MPFDSVRAVVFDAVGTLIHPDPPAAAAYYELGRQHGSRLAPAEVAQNFRRMLGQLASPTRTDEEIERARWRGIIAGVFADLRDTERLFEQLWSHFSRPSHWAVYEDVADAMTMLRSAGVMTVIGSNFDERLIGIARELSPLKTVERIFVSSQLGFTKPSVEFFRAVEEQLQLRPDQLLMIGDDPRNDIEGAGRAGWHRLLLDRDGPMDGPLRIRTLRELASVLR